MSIMKNVLAIVCCRFGNWGLVIKLYFFPDVEHKVWSRFWSWSSGNVWCLQIFVYLRLCCSVFALPWCHSLFQRRVCVSSSSFSWFWLNFTIAFPSMWNSDFKRQSFWDRSLSCNSTYVLFQMTNDYEDIPGWLTLVYGNVTLWALLDIKWDLILI